MENIKSSSHFVNSHLDLRKLIKYEERMGVNTQQNDYYESLFRRTTASFRAKIDKENDNRVSNKRKSFETDKPTNSRQTTVEKRKILGERNNGETSTSSYDVLDSSSHKSLKQTPADPSKQQSEIDESKTDTKSVKKLIEDTITQVLREKYSQELVEKVDNNTDSTTKKKTPIKSVVEQVVKEKLCDLRHSTQERLHTIEPCSLRSIIEDIVTEVLQEKLSNLQNECKKSKDKNESMKNLSQDLQHKLNISKESANKTMDSQALVQKLLAVEDVNKNQAENKNVTKSKAHKENSSKGGIKRLQRSPRKKPEWQDPRPNDNILDKTKRPVRSHSPAASLSARSGRSKCSSSVLIRRSASQGRHHKPNSDPVALYQYYKNEWEHFRKQIPGESTHSRLRWHVRQRLLDPE